MATNEAKPERELDVMYRAWASTNEGVDAVDLSRSDPDQALQIAFECGVVARGRDGLKDGAWRDLDDPSEPAEGETLIDTRKEAPAPQAEGGA